MVEIWNTIFEFDNYEVSNLGNVRKKECVITYANGRKAHYRQKKLKGETTKDGYIRVTLSRENTQKRKLVHRLVAECFIKKDNHKKIVNHIDGVKSNNQADNLEWCTSSENEVHSYDILGKVNPIRKLESADVFDIRRNCIKGTGRLNRGNVESFELKYNVCKSTILNVLKGRYYVNT